MSGLIFSGGMIVNQIQIIILMQRVALPFLLALLLASALALAPAGNIGLYPDTENSPSIYILPFTIAKALPSNSYLLVTMDWYSTSLLPYNCILVNSSIAIACTNLAAPTFPLTITTAQVLKLNPLLATSKTVAVLVQSNLLPNTVYSLQLHLYNVVPNIQKISPSIEMYTVSYNGLVYEANANFGSVVNNPPITNLMGVSILNALSSNAPGSTSTLKAEVTIGQAISTSLSTFIFVMQYPFTFSLGSIPTAYQSSLYSTSPIALYAAPAILSYQILSPNIFVLIFNEQFAVGRKFIVQINQINSPFIIAATNISIYSLNYNTLTPLEAYEMLYPIATVSYPLTLTVGLPYSAPISGAMQFYQNINQFVQLQISIPYSVPDLYSIKIVLQNANMIAGTAYSSFQSLTYTPSYTYSAAALVISGMGPIVIGTVVSVTFQMKITTASLFQIDAYIDTTAVIAAFTAPSYLYSGLVTSSAVAPSTFYQTFYDNTFSSMELVKSTSTIDASQTFKISIYQSINSIATSSSSYIDLFFSPNVVISSSFDQNSHCWLRQASFWNADTSNACLVTYFQTPNYFKMTIKANTVYSNTVPNLFPYNSNTTITLSNLMFSLSSSNKNLYPLYIALYKSDVVNPTSYLYLTYIHAMPQLNQLGGINFNYVNNFYSTSGNTNFQTYPNFLRFESTVPANLNLVVQPNQQLTVVLFASYGIQSISGITNMQNYPCTSNIPVTCTFYQGAGSPYNQTQIFLFDRIAITFTDTSYATTPFHVIIPDTQINANNNYFYYQVGFYNLITKDWLFSYAGQYYRGSGSWSAAASGAVATMGADIQGKAGSYRTNVSVVVYNSGIVTGGKSFLVLSTQWSFFQNGISKLTTGTLAMATPATFGSNNLAPLALYMTGGMYLTVVPFTYVTSTSPFTFYMDLVHMPYTYDLPNYYIYVVRSSNQMMASSNSFLMTNGGTLYSCPLQSLTISCQDNAIGVVSTYCTINFGTSNPLLAYGKIRVSLSGMTVATSTCFLTAANGTSIPVTCISSSDNSNVTVTLLGSGFYTAGNFTLVVYGMGISNASLSQSMTLYLYDSTVQYVIQTGYRILMTTIASLSYISLSQILYSYNSPLSYNTMSIQFSLPRMLYKDEEFAFVIGQDLSDVNSEPARLNIIITRADGVVLYPLFSIDNVNYLIIFSFTDPTQLTATSYVMTIYGICTPASQSNGAFNMIYRRVFDYTYTIVNSANVIFPTFNPLITSNISIASYFNTEGYKQQIDITIVNTDLNIDQNMLWVINFPSYYSPQLFQQDAYCLLDSAVIPCAVDPNTPYQLIVTSSPKTKTAGSSYVISIIGLAAPRSVYTNNAYPSRYIFVGVLQNSSSLAYAERSLLVPYQTIQSTVTGVANVLNMVGVASNLYSFSSIYSQFQLVSTVAITTGSYLYVDLPIQFDNLNNLALNAFITFGSNVISSTTVVRNRRIEVPITQTIPLLTQFIVSFPSLPTPKTACTAQMSDMIITVTPSNKLSIYSASSVQGNSAPLLTFVTNNLYISFNSDATIMLTAGTYSAPIKIASSNNAAFLSNTNIALSSTGFTFNPSSLFVPIGSSSAYFKIGADSDLVPVVYFYQAVKQEEVNTNYQITLNMNINVTNNPVQITLPSSLVMPKGGCTNPFLISLANPPFSDITITYTFDNSLYSPDYFYPNPMTTLSQMTFNSTFSNSTFSFCSTSALTASQIPISFFITGTNYASYAFSPSNQILVNIYNNITNTTPTIALALNNQQKTFLDITFTNNVDGMIFYQMMLGQNQTPLDLQSIQIYLKSNTWYLKSPSGFMTHIYASDVDNRLGQFFQTASTSIVRISNLLPESFYTLCAYIVNSFGVQSSSRCIQLSTMSWGTVIKASLRFTRALTAQELNNVICFFTLTTGTQPMYLTDMEGNSCGNRAVGNIYYNYPGSSVTTETRGTNIYLVTNPSITGTDPSPLAFTNLFNILGQLSAATLAAAQTQFSINYVSGSLLGTSNARLMTQSSQASSLTVYFSTPTYDSTTNVLTVSDVQIVGNVGSVYFVLVLYKQIANTNNGSAYVNIRMNKSPSAEQVLNCQKWSGALAEGCGRVIYTGIAALTVTFAGVQPNSLYMLYYLPATEYPLRPIVSGSVSSQTVITYSGQAYLMPVLAALLLLVLMQ